MLLRPLLLAGSMLALSASVAAAQPAAKAAAGAPSFSAERLTATVKELASDAYEGRGPATEGEKKTVAFITAQMQAIGLQPGGDLKDGKRAWTQDVPLGRFQITGTPTVTATVGGQTITLAQGEDVAIRASMLNIDQVTIARAPIVFLGYGVKADERGWDDFKGADLKGKVGLVLINDPDFDGGEGDFGGKAMTYYGRWTYKFEEAARQGLAGLLIIHETAPASYGWATVKNSNTNTMFDVVRDNPRASHPPMEGWIQRDDAAALLKAAGLDLDTLKQAAKTKAFKPVPLPGATLSADYKVEHSVITSKNVVGVLPGTTRPKERVFYTAHWDHLGVGAPDAKGDRIYNGAQDNALGVAGVLELARAFKAAPRTARTVAFMTVTAEEKGLLGSEYYASKPLYPLSRTVGVLNLDGFNTAGATTDVTVSGDAGLTLQDQLVAVAKAHGKAFTPETTPEAGHFYRSDHFPFAKRGVPALSVNSGSTLAKGGAEAGKAADETYTRDRYHQPADQWDPSWDLTGVTQDLAIVYDLGRQMATSGWPEWKAGSEFKAARDRTAAERR